MKILRQIWKWNIRQLHELYDNGAVTEWVKLVHVSTEQHTGSKKPAIHIENQLSNFREEIAFTVFLNLAKIIWRSADYKIRVYVINYIHGRIFRGGVGGAHPPGAGEHPPENVDTPLRKYWHPPKIWPKRVKIPKKFACGGLTHDVYNKWLYLERNSV